LKKPNEDEAGASAAWSKAREGGEAALAWLIRAAKLAPDDPRIALELAQEQLRRGETAQAATGFASLAARYDLAPAWMGLAVAAAQTGDVPRAAHALGKMLSRHCLPSEPHFAVFASHIANAAGYGGYTGMAASGEIIRHGTGKQLPAKLDQAALLRVEGLARWDKNGISGWAARPAAPGAAPELRLRDAKGISAGVTFGKLLPQDDAAPFLPRHSFRISPQQLQGLTPPFTLAGPHGPQIFGSPLDPAALAQKPVPAARRGRPPKTTPARAKLALLMPVYRGLGHTKAALASVLAAAPKGAKIIVVDDATPEPGLARLLDRLATKKHITLKRHTQNRGFCAAVNTGLAAAKGRDVVLLNADILLPPGAIETLAEIAYAHPATGTVTPLANAASICSYPAPEGRNPMLDLRQATRLNALARAANGLAAVEIPTAVGFCMYIRHDCLAATGGFRGEIFAQGYGEENDFCLRARHLGFRHMAAPGAFIAHEGGVSFRATARGLMARNLTILNKIFPGYQTMVHAHVAADPLARYRTALDAARLTAASRRKGAVLLISHSHGGGVARRVAAELAQIRAQGLQPLLLTTQFPANPKKTPYPWPAQLSAGEANEFPGLAFTLPSEMRSLIALLQTLRVRRVVLHHTLGHHESVRGLANMLNVPQDIVVHDYASFCPRVNLLNRPDKASALRYCGEPAEAACIACTKRKHDPVYDTTPVPQLRARSAAEFANAARVIVPSSDAAKRLQRHFPALQPEINPWEDDVALPALPPPRQREHLLVAVIGGIGPAKGYELLLDCAADAKARNLPLNFIVIGGTANDAKLLESGIYVTGHYHEGEVPQLIAQLKPDLAFLPSIWPETWCFTLGEAWAAGLRAVVFELGAQGERMRALGRGMALPLGLPAQRINDVLLSGTRRAIF
jgi:GT2 family glycosyltransferase/glycosyltransferase involved in cell wall biosynthesis